MNAKPAPQADRKEPFVVLRLSLAAQIAEVRKTAKKAKKAAKKIATDDQKVDTSSVPPKAPFST